MLCVIGLYMYCRRCNRSDCFTIYYYYLVTIVIRLCAKLNLRQSQIVIICCEKGVDATSVIITQHQWKRRYMVKTATDQNGDKIVL